MQQIAILLVLRRHILLIMVLSIISTAAGYCFTYLLQEQYLGKALMLVRPQQPVRFGIEKGSKEFLDFPFGTAGSIETAAKTYIEIIDSPVLLGEVVREAGLDKATTESGSGKWRKYLPAFMQSITKQFQELVSDVISILKYGRIIESDPFVAAVEDLREGLSLKTVNETYSFRISYTATDPARAAQVVNATAAALVRFVNALRLAEAGSQLRYLNTELQQKRERLIVARERLKDYKAAHTIFLYEKEYDSSLKVISELEVERAKTDAKLVGSRDTLSTVNLAAQLARLVQLIDQRKAELIQLPSLELELKQLDQDVKDAGVASEILGRDYEEAEIKLSYNMPEIRLIAEAVPPHVPSSPKRVIITLAALFAGLTAAVGLVLFLEYLNRRVRTVDDVEDLIGLKVLGTIPVISKRDWARAAL